MKKGINKGVMCIAGVLAVMAVVGLVMLTASSSYADVITTGGKSGNYIKVGHRLNEQLGGTHKVITSKGSVENLNRLMSGEAQIGLVQMDAYAWYINKHPEAENALEIMGELYKECAYLAVQCKGKVRDEDGLQNIEGAKIDVGKKGSGTAVTWDYMLQLEERYKNASVVFSGGQRALGKLSAKQIDAVMWVTKPRLDGKMATTVLNNKSLCIAGLNDMDLNDKLPATGKPVYTFQKIDVKRGLFNDKEITTACVDAVIIARADAEESTLEDIANILLNYKSSIVQTK